MIGRNVFPLRGRGVLHRANDHGKRRLQAMKVNILRAVLLKPHVGP